MKAPDRYTVRFETTKGPFEVRVIRDLAPFGADRFYNLVSQEFFDDVVFFRVVEGFVVQFGISGDPQVAAQWRDARIPDDPVRGSNTEGTLTFANAGPGTRTTQVFISLGNNARLDSDGFSPFGEVTKGMDVVRSLYSGYGESVKRQDLIQTRGNAYLEQNFPKLDRIKTARIIDPPPESKPSLEEDGNSEPVNSKSENAAEKS